MSETPQPTVPAEPDALKEAPTLADRDDDQDERGRIGYGRNERKSAYLMGGLLLAVILAIGVASMLKGGDSPSASTPRPAPDFTMTTFEGGTFNLADHRGQVVVLNFWASWCDPCREEMPAFQKASTTAGEGVVFVGVGAKTDKEDDARAFAKEFGITYPIGRDTVGGSAGYGQIAQAYGIYGYPATYIIDPKGNISSTVLGALDTSQLQAYIDKAKSE